MEDHLTTEVVSSHCAAIWCKPTCKVRAFGKSSYVIAGPNCGCFTICFLTSNCNDRSGSWSMLLQSHLKLLCQPLWNYTQNFGRSNSQFLWISDCCYSYKNIYIYIISILLCGWHNMMGSFVTTCGQQKQKVFTEAPCEWRMWHASGITRFLLLILLYLMTQFNPYIKVMKAFIHSLWHDLFHFYICVQLEAGISRYDELRAAAEGKAKNAWIIDGRCPPSQRTDVSPAEKPRKNRPCNFALDGLLGHFNLGNWKIGTNQTRSAWISQGLVQEILSVGGQRRQCSSNRFHNACAEKTVAGELQQVGTFIKAGKDILPQITRLSRSHITSRSSFTVSQG